MEIDLIGHSDCITMYILDIYICDIPIPHELNIITELSPMFSLLDEKCVINIPITCILMAQVESFLFSEGTRYQPPTS